MRSVSIINKGVRWQTRRTCRAPGDGDFVAVDFAFADEVLDTVDRIGDVDVAPFTIEPFTVLLAIVRRPAW